MAKYKALDEAGKLADRQVETLRQAIQRSKDRKMVWGLIAEFERLLMLGIIAEAMARHWCAERKIKPEGWCSYFPSSAGQPARCIETYLEWRMKADMDIARAVDAALTDAKL